MNRFVWSSNNTTYIYTFCTEDSESGGDKEIHTPTDTNTHIDREIEDRNRDRERERDIDVQNEITTLNDVNGIALHSMGMFTVLVYL